MATGTINAPGIVDLPITWVSNTYVTETNMQYIKAYKRNGILHLVCDIRIAGGSAATSDWVTIGTISGWHTTDINYTTIPTRTTTTNPLAVRVNDDGTLRIQLAASVSSQTLYRGEVNAIADD